MTARTFSVMPVRRRTEQQVQELPVHSLEGSLRVGSLCLVEFGGTWGYRGRAPVRFAGQWLRCKVVALESATVVVEFTDDEWTGT